MFTVCSTLIWAILTGPVDWACHIAWSCITVTQWSGSGGIHAWSQRPTGFLQCFDTVGLVIWPIKIVPEMTYYVSSRTLNPTHSRCFFMLTYKVELFRSIVPIGWVDKMMDCHVADLRLIHNVIYASPLCHSVIIRPVLNSDLTRGYIWALKWRNDWHSDIIQMTHDGECDMVIYMSQSWNVNTRAMPLCWHFNWGTYIFAFHTSPSCIICFVVSLTKIRLNIIKD